MQDYIQWLLYIIGLIVCIAVGYAIRKYIGEGRKNTAEELAKKILLDAEKNAEAKKKELLVEAKEEIHKLRNQSEEEVKSRRNELQSLEKRMVSKEELIERRSLSLEKKEESINVQLEEIKVAKNKADILVNEREAELQRVAGMTAEEGKKVLLNQLERELTHEAAVMIRENESYIKDESSKYAREVIAQAIQRCASDQVAEATVSVVSLPNDEMKGRIIGREGRNIRAIESITGVDLIIDDTPEAVVLSSFDPIRREVARLALEKLVSDGRIHPTRIEETIEKARREVDMVIKDAGEQAAYDAGIHGLHPELIKYMGRMKFRTSYGQNVLKHSVEVSHIAGILASEIGADVKIAKRAGFLHDLGKSIDHEVEGAHVEIGVDLARKYRESEAVIHGIEAHHGDVEANTIEAILVQAADAISAARPGARRETVESYIKRLEKLEEIANSFDGIEKSYAVQAGREIRIIVKPEEINEQEVVITARNIVKKIESELDFPGQIKVNVVRETRVIEYAK